MLTKENEIVIIGAGKLASSLTPALLKAGYKVSLVISRTNRSAKRLASANNITLYTQSFSDIRSTDKMFFLAVPDSSLKKIASQLSEIEHDFTGSLVVHFSGALNISPLAKLKAKNADAASFHIMQTFPSRRKSSIKNSFASVEAESEETASFLFKIAEDLGLVPFRIDSGDKTLYHLAGVFTANFLASNFFMAEKLFKPKNDLKLAEILRPIVFSTMNNIYKSSPAKALSGPVERGDLKTIKKHLKQLKNVTNKAVIKENIILNYIVQSIGLADASLEKPGTDPEKLMKIRRLLIKELRKSCKEI